MCGSWVSGGGRSGSGRPQGGRRELPLGAFITGPRQTLRREGELVTAILVPDPAPGARPAAAGPKDNRANRTLSR